MKRAYLRKTSWAAIAAVLLCACAPHEIYRQDLALCTSDDPETECEKNALQESKVPAQPDRAYLLGFIEFDDQGQLFDRRQMDAVVDTLHERSASQDLLIVVFAHGWKHSATPLDDNIRTFREALERLSAMETDISRKTGVPERQVAGVYLGWRGGSVTLPLVEELTFWDRKNTAHKVGSGGVTEVLNRIDLVRTTRDAVSDAGRSRTRLVVVGHSFGGAVVYSALHQILNSRFVHTVGPKGQVSDTQGFGDLVVLINPAFEALLYAPLSDMSTERGHYFPSQLPVLVILTSEADDATGSAFPVGRWFSTFFEKERDATRKNATTGTEENINEGKANITAVGHFEPYRTHDLRATSTSAEAEPHASPVEAEVELFFKTSQGWETDAPGSKIPFDGSVLERTEDSAGRNPYLVVQVDEELIPDHNDIDDPRIASFISQLILISAQSPDPKERQLMRSRALGR